jgi:hypothetical protein
MADVTTTRVVESVDWAATYVNGLTSNAFGAIRTPVHFATERECMERVWPTAGILDPAELRIAWLRNTLELGLLGLSENLRPLLEGHPDVEVVGGPWELLFDPAGNLLDLWEEIPGG